MPVERATKGQLADCAGRRGVSRVPGPFRASIRDLTGHSAITSAMDDGTPQERTAVPAPRLRLRLRTVLLSLSLSVLVLPLASLQVLRIYESVSDPPDAGVAGRPVGVRGGGLSRRPARHDGRRCRELRQTGRGRFADAGRGAGSRRVGDVSAAGARPPGRGGPPCGPRRRLDDSRTCCWTPHR